MRSKSLQGARHAAPFDTELKRWVAKLERLRGVLEMWGHTQQRFLQLEPVLRLGESVTEGVKGRMVISGLKSYSNDCSRQLGKDRKGTIRPDHDGQIAHVRV